MDIYSFNKSIFLQTITNFTIINTTQYLTDRRQQIRKIYDILNEINFYKKDTGIMIGSYGMKHSTLLYLFIFDDKVIIFDKNDITLIIPFLKNNIAKTEFYFLNSQCQKEIQKTVQLKFKYKAFKYIKHQTLIQFSQKQSIIKSLIVSYEKVKYGVKKKYYLKAESERKINDVICNEYNNFVNIGQFKSTVLIEFNVLDQLIYIFKTSEDSKSYENEKKIYELINNQSKYFPKYYGQMVNGIDKYLVIEYIKGQTLFQFIKNNQNKLNYDEKMNIIFEIMIAIEYIHFQNIILRDLKWDNIIVDSDNNIILIDFNNSKVISSEDQKDTEMSGNIGSSYFNAPEQYSSNYYSFKVDIYSLGMIIHFILTEKELSFDPYKKENISSFIQLENCPKKYKNIFRLCKKCLENSPDLRPNISKIINKMAKTRKFKNLFKLILSDRTEQFNCLFQSFTEINKELFVEYLYFYSYINLYSEHFKKNIYKVIHYLALPSNSKNHKAQYILANIYSNSTLIPDDDAKCIHYLTLSSNLGNHKATIRLGKLYLRGARVHYDINKAIYYLNISSNFNNAEAQNILGHIFIDGDHMKRDIEKAIYYLTLSSSQGVSDAQYTLGMIYYNGDVIQRDIEKAIYYLTLSSNSGNRSAQYFLGSIYYNSEYIKNDIKKAIYYLKLSSKQNNCDAHYLLGLIYFNNDDINNAIYYLKLATKWKNPDALYILGLIYLYDEYPMQDINKAIYYLSKSADLNNSDAQYLLGSFYLSYNLNLSIKYLNLSSSQNNQFAQIFLGLIYLNGKHIKKDVSKSIHYLMLASNQNNSYAQYILGTIYLYDLIPRNVDKGLYYLNLASNQNNSYAQYALGIIFYEGRYVPVDIKKAIIYLTLVANKKNLVIENFLGTTGIKSELITNKYNIDTNKIILQLEKIVPKDQCYLGIIYLYDKFNHDINKAIHYFNLSAQQNNDIALLNLGYIYYCKTFNLQDINKAIFYLKLSSNLNNSDAQLLVGIIYYKDYCIPHDINQSIYYLTLSSNNNNSIAQYFLGEIYYFNKYIKKDINKSIYFLTLSSNQNNSDAQNLLGRIFMFDDQIQKNIPKSLHYFTLSANQNNPESLLFLACFNLMGQYTPLNIPKSIFYFTKSAVLGNCHAQCMLGILYYRNEYISRNINKSIYFLTSASNHNHPMALNTLGNIYFIGDFIPQNMQKAIFYYKAASCFYENHAKNNLGIIYKNGIGTTKNIYQSIEYFEEAINQKDDLYSRINLARIYYFGIDIEKNIQKSIQLIENKSKYIFISIFLFVIYFFSDDEKYQTKAKFYFDRIKKISNLNRRIKSFISQVYNECCINSIQCQILVTFFEKYDFIYKFDDSFQSDFIHYLEYGIIKKCYESNSNLNSKSFDINEDFYDGFYN